MRKKYAELLGATYTWYSFFLISFGIMLISAMSYQIFRRSNEVAIMATFSLCIVVLMVQIYVMTYIGQILIEHSTSIRSYVLQSKWYMLPLRAQKMLLMILMRAGVPSKLPVGNLTVVSTETCATIFKTSLSYFTFLRSV